MAKKYKDIKAAWRPTHEDYLQAEVEGDDLPCIDIDMFEGTVEQVKNRLDALEKYAGHPVKLECSFFGYDGGVELDLYVTRKETDLERETRLAKARKERERRKNKEAEKEKREYERFLKLKEKFEGS